MDGVLLLVKMRLKSFHSDLVAMQQELCSQLSLIYEYRTCTSTVQYRIEA